MFEIDGDLILFRGTPVARFEKSAWPSLLAEVKLELDTYDPNELIQHGEEVAALKEDLRDAHERIDRLNEAIDALEDEREMLEAELADQRAANQQNEGA